MIQHILVLGAGTAGLLAALTLKTKLRQVRVEVLRSPDIGVIGVGEGTNMSFPHHIFDYLGISRETFYTLVDPTWKLGIRFQWGPRPDFFYPFATEFSGRFPEVSRANASYLGDKERWIGPISALMAHDKAFARNANGRPEMHDYTAFHVENRRLVGGLETLCRAVGVEITDGTLSRADRGEAGITALHTEDGRRLTADLYLDASGFRSELMGKTLAEPLISFSRSLYCDRAVIGGWDRRPGETILPYTLAETMEAGWAWRIDHEDIVNRGYVYSSPFITDDAAREEFLRKNPRVAPDSTRIVKFTSGRRARAWVGNCVCIGNAGGFVEPLEATAIQVICQQSATLTKALEECQCDPSDAMIRLYNHYVGTDWDDIRNFLSIHYRFNKRIDNNFWRTCQAEVDLAGAEGMVEFWKEHGPSAIPNGLLIWAGSAFGLEGYFSLLKGQQVPVKRPWKPTAAEMSAWKKRLDGYGKMAAQAVPAEEALAAFRLPADAPKEMTPLKPKAAAGV